MASLEDLLREVCKRGLTHLSLSPTPSEDGKKVYWRATAAPSTMHKYVSVNAEDPVEALSVVLAELPKAKTRATKTGADPRMMVQSAPLDPPIVTAAVTQSDDAPSEPNWFNT